ncbi:MAG: hypothetical protein JSV17_15215 [Candidatus Aminicenantes bacterium]|nr:MAG: hypothetical protein JSV17_15215 [Candidatus Aminicenantes bacterium]
MEKGNNKKTEEFLKRFSYKVAPSAMKEKILSNALRRHKTNQVKAAFLRKGFAGCLLTLSIVIAVDATITQAQNRRFSSFLDNKQEAAEKAKEEWSMIKDIIWGPLDSSDNIMKKKFLGTQKIIEKKGRLPEWRESLEKEFE